MRLLNVLGILVLGGIVAFIALNLFDSEAVQNPITPPNLKPASLAADNGFYILWLLAEPAETEIAARSAIMPIRALFDPGYDNERTIAAYVETKISKARSSQAWKEFSPPFPADTDPAGKDWFPFFTDNRQAVVKQKEQYAVLLSRYERLLASPRIEDFTLPRDDAPLPNLVMWMKVAKLSTGIQIVQALDGQWAEAASALIAQVDLCRRSISNSRALVFNLVGKAVMTQSLRALACLLSQEACPPAVMSQVLGGLAPLTYAEFGTRQGFTFEYLAMADQIDRIESGRLREDDLDLPLPGYLGPLLLNSNRTKQYFAEYWNKMIEYESKPPHTWPALTALGYTRQSSHFLWWVRNPVGKIVADIAIPNMEGVARRSYALKARHDLVRISAELHLKRRAGQSAGALLPSLESYRALDPYSGRHYIYNEGNGVLYSIGPDRVDGGGIEKLMRSSMDSDIVMICSLASK